MRVRGGPDAVLEVMRRLGSLQFDPIAVAGRNHDLVLHARVADYDPAWCDELYERQEIFEAYNKGLSFVRVDEFPWFRGILSRRPADVLEHPEVVSSYLGTSELAIERSGAGSRSRGQSKGKTRR